jgi:hypothetical protein
MLTCGDENIGATREAAYAVQRWFAFRGDGPRPRTAISPRRAAPAYYRYLPDGDDDNRGGNSGQKKRSALVDTNGTLQTLKLKGEFQANMDVGREVGKRYGVEWVTIDEADHEDDTDQRRDRLPGLRRCASRRRIRALPSSTAKRASGATASASTSTAPPVGRSTSARSGSTTLTARPSGSSTSRRAPTHCKAPTTS